MVTFFIRIIFSDCKSNNKYSICPKFLNPYIIC